NQGERTQPVLFHRHALPVRPDGPAYPSSTTPPAHRGCPPFSLDNELPRRALPGPGRLPACAGRDRGADRLAPPFPRASPARLEGRCAGLLGGGRMRYLRLLWTFFRVGAMGELAYRGNFFVQLLESLLELGTAIAGLAVIFSYTENLGGWKPDEVLALLGVFFLVGGAIRFMIQPSMEQLIESVRDGTLDFTLAKPESAQVLVSMQRVDIWRLVDVGLGIGVLAVALARLGAHVSTAQALVFA